jgi:opine dehydrogenase
VKSGDWREHIDLQTHRYVREDTELGLAFLASVARYVGVDAPIAHGLLAVTGGFLGRDLRRGPRSLEALGLDGLSIEALQQRLHDGE